MVNTNTGLIKIKKVRIIKPCREELFTSKLNNFKHIRTKLNFVDIDERLENEEDGDPNDPSDLMFEISGQDQDGYDYVIRQGVIDFTEKQLNFLRHKDPSTLWIEADFLPIYNERHKLIRYKNGMGDPSVKIFMDNKPICPKRRN